MRSATWSVLIAAAAASLSPCIARAQSAEPVAVLVRTQGPVQVQRAGEEPLSARPGLPLAGGELVIPAEGAQATLLHRTGRTEVVTRPTTIQPPSEAERAGVFDRTVRTLGNVATASARNDPNRQGMIRPIPGTPVQLSPRNEIAVLEKHPTFTWMNVDGAEGYILQLRPESGAPVRFEVGPDTTWTLSGDADSLDPGTVYHWVVGPTGAGRPGQPMRFRTLELEERRELASALAGLAEQGLDPEDEGLFVAALLYHDFGVQYRAAAALDALARRGEDGGRIYHLLRAQVYDAMGLLDAAAREFALADQADGE